LFAGWFDGWFAGLFAGWFAGWFDGWFAGWFDGWTLTPRRHGTAAIKTTGTHRPDSSSTPPRLQPTGEWHPSP
jgi:hypothetical protein